MSESPAAEEAVPDAVTEFIRRWEASGAAERANYQLFLSELCELLGVPPPEPAGAKAWNRRGRCGWLVCVTDVKG